ncbi:MAG: tetratricopeptide repeat protein [Bryobacteraceae bacterium]|jgi:tetratricopeptide (TPR) repeat protein
MGPNRYPQPINQRPEANRRLDSWKEIAAFLDCGERTVKRWETERGLPVHRMPGSGRGRVSAYTAELSRWLEAGGPDQGVPVEAAQPPSAVGPAPLPPVRMRRSPWWLAVPAVLLCLAAVLLILRARQPPISGAPRAGTGAEDLYLQGRFYWNKRTPESLRRAVDYFAQAIVRDPNYARAYVGLADCYNLLREFSAMPANEAYPKALDAARRAVQLDDASADAHNSLAFVSFYWNWDAAQADREFRRAIQLNPNYVLAHHWRANFLMTVGRLPEALDEIEEARKLDPTSNATLADKGLLLFRMRRFGEALTLLQQIEAQEPRFSSSHFYLTVVHLERKDYPAFLAELREAYTLTQDSQGLAIVAAGEKGLAAGAYRGMFEGMLDVERQLYVKDQLPAYALAQTCGRLGRKAETLSYLRTSLERLEPAMVTLRVDEALDFVRGDAAYQEIVRRFDLGAHR